MLSRLALRSAPVARAAHAHAHVSRSLATMAKLTLIGRVAQPEIKADKNGKEYARFGVATDTLGQRNEDGTFPEPITHWHNIVVFQPNAVEQVKRLEKGSVVYIEADFEMKELPAQDGGAPATRVPNIRARIIRTIARSRRAIEESQEHQ